MSFEIHSDDKPVPTMTATGLTLIEISNHFGVSIADLRKANCIEPYFKDDQKFNKREIYIPVFPKISDEEKKHFSHFYVAAAGDSLWEIARARQIPSQVLYAFNPDLTLVLEDGSRIEAGLMPGYVVKIPRVDANQK